MIQKRMKEVKKMNKKSFLCAVITIVLLFSGCAGDNVPASTEPVVIDETISIVTLGDNLLHMPVVNSGRKEDGSYEYSHIFANLQPEIKNADIAVIGQETIFGGEQFGYSGYPLFNSPSDMGVSLVNEGFDVVLHASNHVLDKGAKGVENTLEFWKNYPDIAVLGINNSQAEKDTVCIKEVKGAKIAFLNYTYSANGFLPPSDKEYLINLIDEEKIQKDATYAEQNSDFTIAFMHWGTEYSTKPDDFQKDLANKMCEWGVDLIVGSHPHVIEPAEWIQSPNGNKMFVYYSLGNFVSRQLKPINLLGGIADVKLHYDGEKVTLKQNNFVPIVTHYDTTHSKFAVYKLKDYTRELGSKHGLGGTGSENWRNMVDKVFENYDKTVLDY